MIIDHRLLPERSRSFLLSEPSSGVPALPASTKDSPLVPIGITMSPLETPDGTGGGLIASAAASTHLSREVRAADRRRDAHQERVSSATIPTACGTAGQLNAIHIGSFTELLSRAARLGSIRRK